MSWATTAPAIASVLSTVEGAGPVYTGDLHIRDRSRFRQLFSWAIGQPGDREKLRGWRIVRDRIEERAGIVAGFPTQSRSAAREHYSLLCMQGLTSTPGSERDFQELLDRALAKFRTQTSLGSALSFDCGKVVGAGNKMIAGVLCHYAEIDLAVEEVYTIPTVTPQPASNSHSASARSSYSAAALQIATYLSSVADTGQVHPERPVTNDEAGFLATMAIVDPLDATKRRIAVWRIYRDANAEERGIGQRIEADADWRIIGSYQWSDSDTTYDAVQRYVDAVREKFRGLWGLGHPINPTMAVSGPLQIPEIGGRMFGNKLVHWADCRLPVEEVIHA